MLGKSWQALFQYTGLQYIEYFLSLWNLYTEVWFQDTYTLAN